ncbi:hypothetical protein NPIL_300461 [Nephila pilipes]|uniref:Uncharacterized protein n=1 Tax=Nephila pilipes TaxID=299642 RepID=A0A8X6QK96_NEPPI|nr:hypothetical protein NPIL_300461 [Nephila pilipes]
MYVYFSVFTESVVTKIPPTQNQIAKGMSPKTPDSHVDGGPVAIVTDAFLEGVGRKKKAQQSLESSKPRNSFSTETIARATDLFEIQLSPYFLIPNPIAATIYNSFEWPLGESATPGSQTKQQNELAPGPGEVDTCIRYCLAKREPQKFS